MFEHWRVAVAVAVVASTAFAAAAAAAVAAVAAAVERQEAEHLWAERQETARFRHGFRAVPLSKSKTS